VNIEDILSTLEESSRGLVAATGRGDLDEAASLIARRATLIRALGGLSDQAAGTRLEGIRSAGERAAAMLCSQRARDVMCLERMRQVAATSARLSSNTKINCVG
jgi:hypothetical protein